MKIIRSANFTNDTMSIFYVDLEKDIKQSGTEFNHTVHIPKRECADKMDEIFDILNNIISSQEGTQIVEEEDDEDEDF